MCIFAKRNAHMAKPLFLLYYLFEIFLDICSEHLSHINLPLYSIKFLVFQQKIQFCSYFLVFFDMPSTFKFTPLYGAENDGPVCSILQIDSVSLLEWVTSFRSISCWIVVGTSGSKRICYPLSKNTFPY